MKCKGKKFSGNQNQSYRYENSITEGANMTPVKACASR